jgi:hypothetical protein
MSLRYTRWISTSPFALRINTPLRVISTTVSAATSEQNPCRESRPEVPLARVVVGRKKKFEPARTFCFRLAMLKQSAHTRSEAYKNFRR